MSSHLRPFNDDELAFIRDRGTRFGKGCSWQGKADAAEAFADGWLIVEGGLSVKGIAENQSQKAARIFTDAAWTEWYRNKSIWQRLRARIGIGMALVSLLLTTPAFARHRTYTPIAPANPTSVIKRSGSTAGYSTACAIVEYLCLPFTRSQ